jgi:outer membrane protein insertion porin family
MMKKIFPLLILAATTLFGSTRPTEPYEGLEVKKIVITFDNQAPGELDETQSIVYKLSTKVGDKFDQELFDHDLKILSEEFDWVEPSIKVEDHTVVVQLHIQKRPIVSRYVIEGSSYRSKKLLGEAELESGMRYDRENFYKSINKIRDFLVKKGFFKAEVSYEIERAPNSNEIVVRIQIQEGPRGRINEILFNGFTKTEEKEILELMRTKTFNVFTSWLTGSGTIKEEQLDPDIQIIVHHLQNEGYVDAHVSMKIEEKKGGKIALVVYLERGEKYFIHDISFEGNSIVEYTDLKKAVDLKPGDVFSIDKVRAAQEKVRDLYAKDGYLQTNVDFAMNLLPNKPEYDIKFSIDESEQSHVGLVLISGNYSTTKNVIYNNIDIEPGEVFDSTKLKSTQQRLQSSGYFKNVNVYPVKSENYEGEAADYRDVMIEVNEAQTGSASLFAGANSTDSVYGGVDLTENNFSIAGFKNVWSQGFSAFRGGGEFFQLKGSVGTKEYGVNASWLNPYLFDSLWRLGLDFEYNQNKIISDDYSIYTLGGAVTASYPLTPFLSYGFKFRARDAIIKIAAGSPEPALEQRLNSGVTTGFGPSVNLDTTDNTFKPHRGVRCNLGAEFAGMLRDYPDITDFPFLKLASLNAFYIPLSKSTTFKVRADGRFIQTFGQNVSGGSLPLSERFFLGGEGTVRGYQPGKIGAYYEYDTDEPKGGVSSFLLSLECAQKLFRPLDIFLFCDAGSVSILSWNIPLPTMSAGVGARVDIGRQLPFMVGYGYPIYDPNITPTNKDGTPKQAVFFSMAGQF